MSTISKIMYGIMAGCFIMCIIALLNIYKPEKVDGTVIITTNNGAIIYDGEIDKKCYSKKNNNEIEIYTKDGEKYTTDIKNVIIIEKAK